VRLASDHGWHVFVATNQSGVARGFYTEAQAQALNDWATDEIRRRGGTIDDWRMCPYLPDAPVAAYARDSDWRKPKPGMLRHLIGAWGLDPAHCVLVGDRSTDAEAARAAGMAAHLFPGGDLLAFVRPLIEGAGLARSDGSANIH
jgi:D-glycero-D-manno-heptose 1,7-bisphosphate phosphatase